MQIWGKKWSLNHKILRQKSGLWSLKTGGLLMQVKVIVITLGRIWKWSLNTGGLLIEVVFRSGLTVLVFGTLRNLSVYFRLIPGNIYDIIHFKLKYTRLVSNRKPSYDSVACTKEFGRNHTRWAEWACLLQFIPTSFPLPLGVDSWYRSELPPSVSENLKWFMYTPSLTERVELLHPSAHPNGKILSSLFFNINLCYLHLPAIQMKLSYNILTW